ncbi:MAG: hypothetical protein KKF41_03905 [Actinobacteria bacterium]|nr:hypothetical protein [Actinomycetota bacterium]MBU1942106.1 hypothetical protein [Actinomycetota bacterium]MBU2686710.1 hypothetical protein [Actinomycetota bacterium]
MECDMECGVTEVTPWDRSSAVRNQVLMSAPVVLGAWAIARHRPRRLLLYLPAAVAFMTLWRRWVCARCRYYGRECSTMLGVMTARMMPRDEEHALDRQTMMVDFAFIGALALIPLPSALKRPRLALAYLASLAAGLTAVVLDACPRCENEFCPMKDVRRSLGLD